jgi:hypothetical protein
MELRELRGDDLFSFLPILGKLLDKHDLELAFKAATGESENAQETGISILVGLLPKALQSIKAIRGDLNGLLADLTGASQKEIQALSLAEYTGLVIALFKKPEIKEVFTSAALLAS